MTKKGQKKPSFRKLGEVLAEARQDALMNLRMAAEALVETGFFKTVDYTSISRYESGARVPNLQTFLGLCQVYGVKPSKIFQRTGLDQVEKSIEEILRERDERLEVQDDEDGDNIRCMIYLPDTLQEDGREIASSRGMNFSEYIRSLIRKDLRARATRLRRRSVG
jgi:transcriptional regulator with XRE-family HTH domain